jgi:U6 snRNA-associated Sm-like protein LSm1
MENLSIQDHASPPPGSSTSNALGPAVAPPVQGAPQLPPQMFTTAAQLLDLTDSKGLISVWALRR